MAKTFWQLMEDKICDECGNAVVKIDDEHYYCPHCQDALSLCGHYGKCEGIAHDHPYILQDGQLIEAAKDGNGWCDMCGDGWEWV